MNAAFTASRVVVTVNLVAGQKKSESNTTRAF